MTGAECFRCGAPAAEKFGSGYLCEDCQPDTTETTADDATETSRDRVPEPLSGLGEVFVPIPPGEKGTRRPRTDDNLFAPTDDVLEAYLEAGHNYGVACHGDLAVLDADEPGALTDLVDALPDTAWQVSGSRSSEHHFLRVPGLQEDIPLDHPETGENLGHVKAAPQSYVVGPGSRHPSGNHYGPLHGDQIATIDEATLRDLIEPYRGSQEANPATVTRSTTPRGDTPLAVSDVLAGYTEGARTEHPFHGSDTGANFMVDEGGETWRCWRHDCTGNALHLVGVEQGVIDCGDWTHGGLDTDTWSAIFDAARDAGYDLPEFNRGNTDHVAVLPDAPALDTATSGWDWRHAGRSDDTLSIDDARDRTTQAIADAYQHGDRVLIEALPTMGKSYGAIEAAAGTGRQISMFTGRGHKEQYEQLQTWCEEFDLDYYTLPAFTRDCTTANGEHGAEWADTVRDWYHRGATPRMIHKAAEAVTGEPLPCQHQDDSQCPYASKWDFNPDDYDVLIGHYAHAHKSKVASGRVCVFDEFPDAYETTLGHGLEGAVSYWLSTVDDIPFADFTELLEHRDTQERRAEALLYFEDHDLDSDEAHVFDDSGAHALAPLAVYTLLASDNLDNGFETADLDDTAGTGVYNRTNSELSLLRPPDLQYASGVVALDGTPTKDLWELALGQRLNHRQVLQPDERADYLQDALNLNLVRTTDAVKPYNSSDHVNVARDAALLEEIGDAHGDHPALITTSTAEHDYDDAGILDDLVGASKHYGNVLGSNEFDDTRLGAVIGSNHYGDQYIQKWGAYAGHAVERNDEKGQALSYGGFGDRILAHMREHDTLQAAMRFGRDGNGAVVYVHTNTLPDWVPLAGEGRVISTWSDGMQGVLEALQDLDVATTAETAAHPAVDVGRRQVLGILEDLRERGVLAREQDPDDGRRVRWTDDGLHRLSDHGDVELEPVTIEELDAEEVAELARSSSYTWEFRNHPGSSANRGVDKESGRSASTATAANGGEPPPDDAD